MWFDLYIYPGSIVFVITHKNNVINWVEIIDISMYLLFQTINIYKLFYLFKNCKK
jgi:hypothetical protein